MIHAHKAILLFDGYCNLCSFSVQFVIKHQKSRSICFVPLQSDLGKSYLISHGIDPSQLNSVVFIEKDKAYQKSKAVFKVAVYLKFPFSLLRFFTYLPLFVSDCLYGLFAQSRFRLFGKRDSCFLPEN